MRENLEHFAPSEEQYKKFEEINSLSEERWEVRCVWCNDCALCYMAIHQTLLSTTTHTCVYGMSKKEFEMHMDNADCDF